MFFLTCNLVPQFKAGGRDHEDRPPVGDDEPGSCDENSPVDGRHRLLSSAWSIFTATVVAYTTYGGFLAAIWTDVFQSIIMAIGVMILFPLAMAASGGLESGDLRRHGSRPTPASPSARGGPARSTRSAWRSRSSSCGRSPAWASPRRWSA